jgi:hypothetical protein
MRAVILAGLLVLSAFTPALAQDAPTVDLAGGYSFLNDQDLEDNLHGWVASAAGNVNRWFAVVGEIGGNYKTIDVLGTDVKFSVYSFMGGPRFMGRPGKVAPFGQLLMGAVRGSVSVLGESESVSDFALQPGGGVDFWLTQSFGIRIGGDYRRIFAEDEGSDEFRFYTGVVLGAGTGGGTRR